MVHFSDNIKPFPGAEYEITDVNNEYLRRDKLQVGEMNSGAVWLDTGTFDSLSHASDFVRVIDKRQCRKMGCIEETVYRMGLIDHAKLDSLALIDMQRVVRAVI